MNLILKPSLHDGYSREELMEYIEGVRARRMVAVLAYHNHQNSKIAARSDKIGVKAKRHLDGLMRDIAKIEKLEESMLERLLILDGLAVDSAMLTGQMVDTGE